MLLKKIFKKFKEGRGNAKKYRYFLRKLEEELNLNQYLILPNIGTGFWFLGIRAYLCPPLLFSDPLATAIHELRHRLQIELKVPLLDINRFEEISELKKEIDKIDNLKDFIWKEQEKDALLIEWLASLLYREGKLEEFKQLMLRSKIP